MIEISKFAKFEVGQVIKNYTEFCELLEVEFKKGTPSRNAQKKEWKRYLSWDEKGHKYIITEVRDIPIDKVDGRCNGNNSKYVKYTRELLLDYIYASLTTSMFFDLQLAHLAGGCILRDIQI